MSTPTPPQFGGSEFGATPFGPPGAANTWNTQTNYTSASVVNATLVTGVGEDLRQWGGGVNGNGYSLANLASLGVGVALRLGTPAGVLYLGRPATFPYLGFNVDVANAFSFADANNDYFSVVPGVGVGVLNTTPATALDVAGVITMRPKATPPSPSSSSESRDYISISGYAVEQYNDAGTVRYKYMPLFGTSVTWVESTTAP